ncbi:MAG: SEL1-like repeat protein [Alphaproteobacteria bacterium]|jgi:hypothetical protein
MVFRLAFVFLFLASGVAHAACDWAERAEKSGKNAIAIMQYMYCAEEENDAEAQYKLGALFYQGKSLKKPDFRRAVVYFALSARNGYAPAQSKLGLLYWRGEGVTKNLLQAYKWLYLAQEPQEIRWFYPAGASADPTAKNLYRQIKATVAGVTGEGKSASPSAESIIFSSEIIPFQHDSLRKAGQSHLSETEYQALDSYLNNLKPPLLTPGNFDLKNVPVLNILKNKISAAADRLQKQD